MVVPAKLVDLVIALVSLNKGPCLFVPLARANRWVLKEDGAMLR